MCFSVCVYFFFFFFFKQKTAYEMRISDWSSDVCSSDLSPKHANEQYPLGIAPLTSTVFHAASRSGRNCSRPSRFGLILSRVGDRAVKAQIGRASCRERVCQYV